MATGNTTVNLSPTDRTILRDIAKSLRDSGPQGVRIKRADEVVAIEFVDGAVLKVVGDSAEWSYPE